MVVFGFLALALVFPLSALLSGAALVLITLHAGPKNAAIIVIACMAALAVFVFFVSQHPLLGAITALAQLLPSLMLASIFYSTRSLSLSLQTAALLGAVSFVVIALLFPDHAQFWQTTLTAMLAPVFEARGTAVRKAARCWRKLRSS